MRGQLNREVVFSFVISVLLMSTLSVPLGVYKARASGTIYIRTDGSIDPPTANITRSGNIYYFTDDNFDAIVVERSDIVIDGEGHFLQGNGGYGITIFNVSNVTVQDLNIINFWSGIHVIEASNCRVVGNNITNTGATINHGVFIKNSSGTTVTENRVIGKFEWGVRLSFSSYNEISGNTINGMTGGVGIQYSPHNQVLMNTIGNVMVAGIGVSSGSFNITIAENHLADIGMFGISIEHGSDNSSVYRNTVMESYNGINIVYVSNSVFYQNNFINNTHQVNMYAAGYANDWDNGFDGNYWSDYTGADGNNDGIGDTPYVIDADNIDNYPLMNLYWNPADVNHDLEVDIYDVVMLSGAYLSTPSDSNWNPHCDLVEPYEVIDIYDVVFMCGCYGDEYEP